MATFMYNFENLIKPEEIDKKDNKDKKDKKVKKQKEINRPNMKIAKCCGNCKFFWYHYRIERKGFCKFGNDTLSPIDKKTPNPAWLDKPVHITTVCDNHIIRGKKYSIGRVEAWVKKSFDMKGNQIP